MRACYMPHAWPKHATHAAKPWWKEVHDHKHIALHAHSGFEYPVGGAVPRIRGMLVVGQRATTHLGQIKQGSAVQEQLGNDAPQGEDILHVSMSGTQ